MAFLEKVIGQGRGGALALRVRPMGLLVVMLLLFSLNTMVVKGGGAREDGLIASWSFDEGEGAILFEEDFEATGEGAVPSGWTIYSGQPVVSSDKASSGSHSVKFVDQSTTTSVGLRSPQIPVEEGLFYLGSADTFNESGISQLYLEFWDGSGQRILALIGDNQSIQKWQSITVSGKAPEGSRYATLLFYSHGSNQGISYYDAAVLSKAPQVPDLSGNERHGLVKGEAVEWVKGRWGKALRLDGVGNYVEIAMDEGLRSTRVITIEAWIYPTPPHQQGYGGIINNINGYPNSRLLVRDDGMLMAQPEGSGSGKPTFLGPYVTNNAWNHVLFVYTGSEMIWYLNGERKAVMPYSVELPVGSNPLTIGWGFGNSAYYHFNGLIDEVKIYNRPLSEEEIQYKYENPPAWNGVIAYPNPSSEGEGVRLAYFAEGVCDIQLSIYNENGVEVLRLRGEATKKGYNEITWDGRDKMGEAVPGGVYFAVISILEEGGIRPIARGTLVRGL